MVWLVLIAVAAGLVLPGCAKKAEKQKELTLYLKMLPNQEKFFRNEVLNAFEKENNCKINTVQ
jgi:ABC-type glycerol-3-phosphate transport system substrate-binding protein